MTMNISPYFAVYESREEYKISTKVAEFTNIGHDSGIYIRSHEAQSI